MKPEWKSFLIEQGAEFDGSTLLHFGNPERERRIPPQGAVLCDLSHQGLISVTGSDATSFLQGQLSNDINQVTESRAQLSSYSSPKGRAYTTFQIMQRQGVYYLALSSDILEAVLKRLRMFVMRSKVALEDASESVVHFGYADPQGEQRLKTVLGKFPEQNLEVVQLGNLTIVRQAASVPRFEIYGELEDACQLWNRLSVHAAAVGPAAWDYFDIEAGIPKVTAASMEAWVPQMINLHLIDGISFKKGCFPGQEIVARLKYLGKNKRQMYRVAIEDVHQPAVGAKIQDRDGEEAGEVLNSVLSPSGDHIEALAVLKIAATEQALNLAGAKVRLLTLPYSLDSE
ncbi:folate-binding protein [uncultured Thiothrix sp.]|uniref:CAF17-like 4Fe-4S cluster assembly/insertion protein YgfZ n=1 Tax=uncultured Thiothrix sp. TaxID=223185 RepID=UPI0026170375|nr:folate-binding protein [uncultured Thiothrix sp.]